MSGQTGETDLDHLALFLRFADTVQAAWERAHRPVYAETCPCGGSVEVGRDASPAERRRIQAAFWGRHRECPDPRTESTPHPRHGRPWPDAECVGFPPKEGGAS